MMLHVLKNDPASRELEHVQVDGSGMAYLFFYDRHGHHGLMWEAARSVHSHLVDTFSEWIGWPTHFEVLPLLLDEGCHHAAVAQDRCQQHIRTQDPSNLPVQTAMAASSGSSLQLVGRAPLVPEGWEGDTGLRMPRASAGRPHELPRRQGQ